MHVKINIQAVKNTPPRNYNFRLHSADDACLQSARLTIQLIPNFPSFIRSLYSRLSEAPAMVYY